MADDQNMDESSGRTAVASVCKRRSTRKRKVVESYAADDSQILDDITKPAKESFRKRKKPSLVDLTGDGPVHDEPSSALNVLLKPGRTKGNRLGSPMYDEGESHVGTHSKGKVKELALSDEEKRLKRW